MSDSLGAQAEKRMKTRCGINWHGGFSLDRYDFKPGSGVRAGLTPFAQGG